MKTLFITLLFLSSFSFATQTQEDILEQGQELHDESCLACHIAPHNKGFYSRENRKVTNISALKGQVSRCISALNLDWFPEEENSVRFYLNHNFYNFLVTPTITQ